MGFYLYLELISLWGCISASTATDWAPRAARPSPRPSRPTKQSPASSKAVYRGNPSLRSPKARRTWGYNCGRPILALNKDILGPEAGCSPGKIILVQMTLNTFGNVHRPPWTVAVLSQNQDFWHAAFWLILAKKVRVPVVAKAHFVESGPPGARQPWWREHRADRDRNRFPPGISPL